MRVKAKLKRDMVVVKVLAKHPMETGLRKDKKTGKVIPAKFIQELTCKHDGKLVFQVDMGRAVSKNPYLAFEFAGGKKGDKLELSWSDNTGATEEVTAEVK